MMKYRITPCVFKRSPIAKRFEHGFYVYRWSNNTYYILDKDLEKVHPPYYELRTDEVYKSNVIFNI